MYNWYQLLEYAKNSRLGLADLFILIAALSALFMVVLAIIIIINKKRKGERKDIGVYCFLTAVMITGICAMPFAYVQEKGKFEKKVKEGKLNVTADELISAEKKLKKFCENYYSVDKNFCSSGCNGNMNEYTFNMVFDALKNPQKDRTQDVENAVKFIKEK